MFPLYTLEKIKKTSAFLTISRGIGRNFALNGYYCMKVLLYESIVLWKKAGSCILQVSVRGFLAWFTFMSLTWILKLYHYFFFLLAIYGPFIKIFSINDEITKILHKMEWKSLFISKTLPTSISSSVFFLEVFSHKSIFRQTLLFQGRNTNSKWVPKIIKKMFNMVQKYPPTNFKHSCLYCFLSIGMVFSQNGSLQILGRM